MSSMPLLTQVWSGDRVHEWEMKIDGATYMDIHKAGGGIGFTVEKTRAAGKDELLQALLKRLRRMMKLGTTLVEAKSGYGLESETEMKMLQVIRLCLFGDPRCFMTQRVCSQ